MGVVFGFLAISVDVGNLLWSSAGQLQNAADAAALSLRGRAAARAPASRRRRPPANRGLANNNVRRRLSTDRRPVRASTCRRLAAHGVPRRRRGGRPTARRCPPAYSAGDDRRCPTSRCAPQPERRTAAACRTGSPSCRRQRTGRLHDQPPSTPAPARPWARRAAATATLPITISACDWQHATGGTTGGGGVATTLAGLQRRQRLRLRRRRPAALAGRGSHAPGADPTAREVILLAQNPPGGATMPSSCPTWSGHALPGGFGILETTVRPVPVRGVPVPLDAHRHRQQHLVQPRAAMVGKVINLPIFDCTADTVPGTGG